MDVLELGQHLARELEVQEGTDTLGRWMAHHLAELFEEIESAKTEEERARAEKRATETILRIWEYRKSLPGEAYPLNHLSRILETIDQMGLDMSQKIPAWALRDQRGLLKQATSTLLFDLPVLEALLLKISTETDEMDLSAPRVVIDALDEEERVIWERFQHLNQLLEERLSTEAEADSSNIDDHGDQMYEAQGAKNLGLETMAFTYVDRCIDHLTSIKDSLSGQVEDPVSVSLRELVERLKPAD